MSLVYKHVLDFQEHDTLQISNPYSAPFMTTLWVFGLPNLSALTPHLQSARMLGPSCKDLPSL